jgi:hypothetical protein
LPNRTAKPAAASSDSFSAHTSTKLEMLGATSHYFLDMGTAHANVKYALRIKSGKMKTGY